MSRVVPASVTSANSRHATIDPGRATFENDKCAKCEVKPGISNILAFPPRPLRWLFLDLNSYFASVEQQLDPALRGRPVIVAPVDADTTVAIAASVEAKRYGITTGTPVWEARRKCREVLIVPARHQKYVEFHDAIVAEIWKHIPVTHVCSIDEVACRLLDNENTPEIAVALARRIKAGIRAHVGECLTSSVGIAPNRLLAKLASDLQKPDGLVVFTADQLPHRLYGLKLREISGIGAKMERRLAQDGILDIRQLCERRPRDAGTAWGGTNGDRLWYLLHGVELPEKPTQSRTIGHSHVLSPGKRGLEPTRLTARRLALKAASRLRRKGYRSRLLVLHGKFEDDKSNWRASIKLPHTQDSFVILAALDTLFPRLAAAGRLRAGGFRLRMVGVTLCEIEAVEGEQGSLFAALDPDDPLARETRTLSLSRAMDRINEKFGRHAVSVGPLGGGRIDAVGTKIAFGRIPDLDEFHE
ncbi:type VI secretion protein ImpB [Sphingomonas sp. HF-S4]|uniref:DNA-directed DNA polymerase n=1 Tax=Sphingomonas agrestis TaxID=3080540 RepID=A0ABU3Y3K5_9SPHN|nr:type VI secretion protein ImpB [Sphingomonas sp. HF-S4]MDV3455909.1 type VI secretion protein ImpB [Sphingomonas sp. HF-S4]